MFDPNPEIGMYDFARLSHLWDLGLRRKLFSNLWDLGYTTVL
jgi:hypothetical protein